MKPTDATQPQTCARCGDAILPGARVQRGCHWRCYIAAWRSGAADALPRGRVGRPLGTRSKLALAHLLAEASHGR